MPKSPKQRILELETKVKMLGKKQLERQYYIADSKAIIFDMMIAVAEKNIKLM